MQFVIKHEISVPLLVKWEVAEQCCGPVLACLGLVPCKERWKLSFNRGTEKNSHVLEFRQAQDIPELLKTSLARM